ncbi:MAG: hypothetical protein JSS10_06425 [Verrucomicrobia bacterium]|nr:hypothetical protein [Verrucomicrobiota bacterium]
MTSNLTIYSYVAPYLENKNIRYSAYAASILTVGAASWKFGNITLGLTLASAGLFIQGHKAWVIGKEIKNNPSMSDAVKKEKISRITDRVFMMGMIWGIITSGLTLSLIFKEGRLLLRGAEWKDIQRLSEDLSKNPLILMDLWVKNAPAVLFKAQSLAGLGCIAAGQGVNFLRWSEDHFYGKKLLANTVFALCDKIMNIWIQSQNMDLISLFFMIKDTIQAIDIGSYLSKVVSEVPPNMQTAYLAFKTALPLLYRFPHITGAEFSHWIRSFSNPPPAFPDTLRKSSSSKEKIKHFANYFFFYSFNCTLMATQLYYHPIPTALFFGVGFICPTGFQTEETIRRTWEIAPDFIGMPLALKCRYILDRVSTTALTLKWWNYPAAIFNGLCLNEDVRYYAYKFRN